MENNKEDLEMFEKNKKIIGQIVSYDGEVGFISTGKKDYYLFTKKDLETEYINVGDTVEFYQNIVPFADEKFYVARYIDKALEKSYIEKGLKKKD